jgi:hypothetical protein
MGYLATSGRGSPARRGLRAGHAVVHQPALRGIHSQNIEYFGAYDTAMHLNYIFIFRHRTSKNSKIWVQARVVFISKQPQVIPVFSNLKSEYGGEGE